MRGQSDPLTLSGVLASRYPHLWGMMCLWGISTLRSKGSLQLSHDCVLQIISSPSDPGSVALAGKQVT